MTNAERQLDRIAWLARLGLAARGLVYLLAGVLILLSGRGFSAGTVVAAVHVLPFGPLLLALIGAGLIGYGLWRLVEAALDRDGKGDDWRGRAARMGAAISGLAYWALALIAIRTLLAGRPAEGGDEAARGAALEVAHQPGGNLLLLLGGAVLIGIAFGQARISWRCDFMARCDQRTPDVVRHLGRAGFAARAMVIALVGWFVVRAALVGGTVRGMGGAIDALRAQYLLMMAVGVGLILFGLFSFALARYQRL